MADLLQADEEDTDAGLDEDEVQILKKAKILSDKAEPRGKRRKHLLFAENVVEGTFLPVFLAICLLTCEPSIPTYQKRQRQRGLPCCGAHVLEFPNRSWPWLDNGWIQEIETENDEWSSRQRCWYHLIRGIAAESFGQKKGPFERTFCETWPGSTTALHSTRIWDAATAYGKRWP